MDMKTRIAQLLADTLHKTWPEAEGLPEAADIRGQLAVPPDPNLGDYAFPCFRLCQSAAHGAAEDRRGGRQLL